MHAVLGCVDSFATAPRLRSLRSNGLCCMRKLALKELEAAEGGRLAGQPPDGLKGMN